jgi:hypothetical protein
MAQTKRKRQTKHRGNAAGSVTTRGRTGRPPTAEERKVKQKSSREEMRLARLNRRPTWKAMTNRAALASGLMFILLLVVDKGHNILFVIVFAIVAFALYVPAGFYLEMFLWKRRMAKQGKSVR